MSAPLRSGSDGLRTLTESAGAVAVGRDVVTAIGPDTSKFLQSQLSQDVVTLDVGASAWSFLLQPTGKLIGFFRVTRVADDGFRLDGDPGVGVGVEAALRRFLIRTKCTITLQENVPCWAVRGPDTEPTSGAVACFPTMEGFDLLGADAPPGIATVAPECLEYLRIAAGVAVWPYELSEATIPNATGLVDIAVNFSKGCYVGQELVERIDSRGAATPKLLRRIRFDLRSSAGATGALTAGAEMSDPGGPRGTITSVALNPDGSDAVALGYLHRDVAVGSAVSVGVLTGDVRALGNG